MKKLSAIFVLAFATACAHHGQKNCDKDGKCEMKSKCPDCQKDGKKKCEHCEKDDKS